MALHGQHKQQDQILKFATKFLFISYINTQIQIRKCFGIYHHSSKSVVSWFPCILVCKYNLKVTDTDDNTNTQTMAIERIGNAAFEVLWDMYNYPYGTWDYPILLDTNLRLRLCHKYQVTYVLYTAFIIDLTGPYSGTRDTGRLWPSNIQFLTQSRTASPKFQV